MGFGNVSKNYPDTSTTLQHYSTTSTVNRLMSMRLYSYYFSLTRHKPERLVECMPQYNASPTIIVGSFMIVNGG